MKLVLDDGTEVELQGQQTFDPKNAQSVMLFVLKGAVDAETHDILTAYIESKIAPARLILLDESTVASARMFEVQK